MLVKIIVCVFAGLAAGVLTGFSGISAAVVVTPALVSILGFDAYSAVGVAMASDVIASAATALNFGRHGNLRIKDALQLMAVVLAFVFVGSWASQYIPSPALGSIAVLLTPLSGLKFLLFPQTNLSRLMDRHTKKEIFLATMFVGAAIGFISGFAGAGGGEMLLFALTTLLCYGVKEAVGTSVFIMTFIALVGCASHIYIGGWPDLTALLICVAGNFLGAVLASRIANKIASSTLNKLIGSFLVGIGVIMVLAQFVF